MNKLVLLILAALVLATVSSVNAGGLAKQKHHGKKAATHVAGKHHKIHHAKAHHHKQA